MDGSRGKMHQASVSVKPTPGSFACPEVEQALAEARKYAELAAQATTPASREAYLKSHRKWRGLALGWSQISEVGKVERSR